MREEIEKIIADEIRPRLEMDGGGVDLVDVTDDGEVSVRLTGACHGCPMAQMTLTGMVESMIKEKVSGVRSVKSV